MQLSKFVKKYRLIIFLAVIAGLLFGIKLLFSKQTDTSVPGYPTPTNTNLPTQKPQTPTLALSTPTTTRKVPTPTLKVTDPQGTSRENFTNDVLENYPLTPNLPYPKENINLRYTAPLTLTITKEGSITAEDKQEILDWIEDQGVDPNTHEITWKVE